VSVDPAAGVDLVGTDAVGSALSPPEAGGDAAPAGSLAGGVAAAPAGSVASVGVSAAPDEVPGDDADEELDSGAEDAGGALAPAAAEPVSPLDELAAGLEGVAAGAELAASAVASGVAGAVADGAEAAGAEGAGVAAGGAGGGGTTIRGVKNESGST
jgi:hypothetical protein